MDTLVASNLKVKFKNVTIQWVVSFSVYPYFLARLVFCAWLLAFPFLSSPLHFCPLDTERIFIENVVFDGM